MERNKQKKETIAGRLKRFRIENDLTLEQIANKAGLAAPTVYRIENGLAEPNERTLYKLGRAFPQLLDNAA
jgi:transcriptional regulator with XRE-family HTH domain